MAEKTESTNTESENLVNEALDNDEGKDEAALWAEIEQAEAAAPDPNADKPPAADMAGDHDEGEEEDAAAKASKESGDSAANRDPGADGTSGDKSSDAKASDKGKPPESDLWENATPEQRAAYDAAQTQLKKLEQAERSNRGRISAFQRQLNELTRSDKKAAPPAGDAAGKGDGKSETVDGYLESKGWKDFAQEYPEVAGPLSSIITDLQSQLKRQDKELSAIGTDRREQALNEQENLLVDAHPDWEQVTEDPNFGTWLSSQPRHMREAADRNANAIVDAQEAADVIGRFKDYRSSQGSGTQQDKGASADNGGGKPNQQAMSGKRRRQLESAATARTRSPTGVASGIPEDGDPEEIWKQFEEQDRRQQRA